MKTKINLLAVGMFLAAVVNSFGQPTLTAQPKSQTASLFADVTFRVTATGTGSLTYQWRFNATPIADAVANSLTITNVQKTNAGAYTVVVTAPSGSVTSQVATLTITPFNSIYCFGFSWTQTQNCGSLDPFSYWQNRVCNGPVWPEFLSTNLGLAYAGANNYAVCGATSSGELNQVLNFRAPPKPQLSLYFLWVGGAEFLRALPPDGRGFGYLSVTNEVAWNGLIQTSVLNSSNAVNRLYAQGARAIIFQTRLDLSKYPDSLRRFGTDHAGLSKLGEYCARFNAAFIDVMNTYSQTRQDLRILFVDVFAKLNEVLANPAQYGFTQTTIDALGDPSLANKTFTGPGADYVFWDSLHGTSKLHELIAAWHLQALTKSSLETLGVTIAGGSPNIQMSRLQIGRDYTLQSSSDLIHWEEARTFTASAGTDLWPMATATASRTFYRLKWQP